jgi:hypothetical protein
VFWAYAKGFHAPHAKFLRSVARRTCSVKEADGFQPSEKSRQDVTALAVAGHLENVFGGWQPPPLAVDP